MILVLADDFTGAAEIGAVALRFGLSSDVETKPDLASPPEVICLDTGTRALQPNQIERHLSRILEEMPTWRLEIFKKVDSVLRGPVLSELDALLGILNKSRVILVPANPALGRTVRSGIYCVNGKPLHETDFARDPEFPIHSSHVLEILGRRTSRQVSLEKSARRITGEGIFFGEADCRADLLAWANELDGRTLPAGASGFFEAFVETRGFRMKPAQRTPRLGAKTLFVSGSSTDYSRTLSQRFRKTGAPVLTMPQALFEGSRSPQDEVIAWAREVSSALQDFPVVRASVDRPVVRDIELSGRITDSLAGLVQIVLQRVRPDQLCVEGGATVSSVARRLGWCRLAVLGELGPGSVVLRPGTSDGPLLIAKPGSYPWPERFLARCLSS